MAIISWQADGARYTWAAYYFGLTLKKKLSIANYCSKQILQRYIKFSRAFKD